MVLREPLQARLSHCFRDCAGIRYIGKPDHEVRAGRRGDSHVTQTQDALKDALRYFDRSNIGKFHFAAVRGEDSAALDYAVRGDTPACRTICDAPAEKDHGTDRYQAEGYFPEIVLHVEHAYSEACDQRTDHEEICIVPERGA